MEAKRAGISGSVLIEARVAADGSTRAPLAWFSFPEGVFEEAGRAVALNNRYTPTMENGVCGALLVRFMCISRSSGAIEDSASSSTTDTQAYRREKSRPICGRRPCRAIRIRSWSMASH